MASRLEKVFNFEWRSLAEYNVSSGSAREAEHTPYCAPTRELSRRLFDILLRTALPSLDILTRRPRKTACTRTMPSIVCSVVAACLRTVCPRTNAWILINPFKACRIQQPTRGWIPLIDLWGDLSFAVHWSSRKCNTCCMVMSCVHTFESNTTYQGLTEALLNPGGCFFSFAQSTVVIVILMH